MNIRDLKYLVSVADHAHFGKAANACFVSQPALSMQIKKLEETLGIQLLERTNKSVFLTDTGATIAAHAREILNQVQEMHEIAQAAKDPYSGELKIGIFPTLAPYLLPLIIPTLSHLFPKLSFYLIEEPTAFLIEKLKQGKLHAVILAMPVEDSQFTHSVLFAEEFFLAVPKKHPLARKKTVKPQDLDNKELLLLDEGHCMRAQALSWCHQMNATEMHNFRATSLETLRHMIAAGVGITLMPRLACNPNNHIHYIPFSGVKPTRSLALFWRTSSAKQLLLTEIADQIKKILFKK